MKLTTKEIILFPMLGTILFLSKLLLEALPNVHLVAMLTIVYTILYGKKALYPIYIYAFLVGLFYGFSLWWIPHLYLWTLLWGITMLIPKEKTYSWILYSIVCSLHGFLYGILYAPAQAILFGLSFQGMIAWIIAGFPFDMIHGISNACVSILILPLTKTLKKIR